jgi:hypothetical protein
MDNIKIKALQFLQKITKWMLALFPFGVFVFALFGAAASAHAATYFNFDGNTVTRSSASIGGGYETVNFRLGHPIANGTVGSTLSRGYYRAGNRVSLSKCSNSSCSATIYEFTDANYSSYDAYLQINGVEYPDSDASGTYANFDSAATFSFDTSKWYFVQFLSYAPFQTLTASSSNGDGIDWGVTGPTRSDLATNIINGRPYLCVGDSIADCAASPPPGASMINFVFPENGTTTPPFSPWILSIDGATTTNRYRAEVQWTRINHDCGYNALYFTYFSCRIWNDKSVSFHGSTSTILLPITKPDRDLEYVYDKFTDDLWAAEAFLYDETQGRSFVATSTINFTMLRYYGDYGGSIGAVGTTTYQRPIINASGTIDYSEGTSNFTSQVAGGQKLRNASSTSGCTPASDWTDVGGGISYGLCTATNQLFSPGEAYTADIQNSFANLQGDFPFSFAYSTLGAISTAAQAATASTSSLSLPLWGANITILSSSTLSGFVGESNKDMIFKAQDAVAWVGVAWAALAVIF